MKYGRIALNLHSLGSSVDSFKGEIRETIDHLFNPNGVRRLKTFIEYEQTKGDDPRTHAEYHMDLLEESGLLKTLDLKMVYLNYIKGWINKLEKNIVPKMFKIEVFFKKKFFDRFLLKYTKKK